ncbi:MAG: tetratricopeptide repeat protein [Myxococcota bacterium]
MSDKRLSILEQMTQSGQADTFAWYGLAMEYRKRERWDDALRTFETLREREPTYVPQYLMCGQMLAERGDVDAAEEWLEQGIEQAEEAGDMHALSELNDALGAL